MQQTIKYTIAISAMSLMAACGGGGGAAAAAGGGIGVTDKNPVLNKTDDSEVIGNYNHSYINKNAYLVHDYNVFKGSDDSIYLIRDCSVVKFNKNQNVDKSFGVNGEIQLVVGDNSCKNHAMANLGSDKLLLLYDFQPILASNAFARRQPRLTTFNLSGNDVENKNAYDNSAGDYPLSSPILIVDEKRIIIFNYVHRINGDYQIHTLNLKNEKGFPIIYNDKGGMERGVSNFRSSFGLGFINSSAYGLKNGKFIISNTTDVSGMSAHLFDNLATEDKSTPFLKFTFPNNFPFDCSAGGFGLSCSPIMSNTNPTYFQQNKSGYIYYIVKKASSFGVVIFDYSGKLYGASKIYDGFEKNVTTSINGMDNLVVAGVVGGEMRFKIIDAENNDVKLKITSGQTFLGNLYPVKVLGLDAYNLLVLLNNGELRKYSFSLI